jgi:hypothetical protein
MRYDADIAASGTITAPSGIFDTLTVSGQLVATGTGGGSALTVEEQDGVPSVSDVTTIKVTNATLTDEGGGVVSIDTGGTGGGGGGELTTSGMWFNVHAVPEDPSPYSDFFDDNSTNPTLSGSHPINWDKWTQWDVDAVSGTTSSQTMTAYGGGNGTVKHDSNMMRITHDSSTTGGWTGVYQDAPPGSFTITTRVGIQSTFQSNVDIRMGIFMADDLAGAPSTSDLYSASLYHVPTAYTNDSVGAGLYSQVEGALWTDYNSISTEWTTAAGPYPGISSWLRINYNSSSMVAETSISEDGITWKKLSNETLAFTPSHIGFGIQKGSGASAVSAVFEFFAVHDSLNNRGDPSGYGRLVPVVISGSTGGGSVPAFRGAKVSLIDGGVSVADLAKQALSFQVDLNESPADYDTDGFLTASGNDYLEIPAAFDGSRVRLTGQILWGNNSTGFRSGTIRRGGGSGFSGTTFQTTAASPFVTHNMVTPPVTVTGGQQFKLFAWNSDGVGNSGSTDTQTISKGSQNWFAIEVIE